MTGKRHPRSSNPSPLYGSQLVNEREKRRQASKQGRQNEPKGQGDTRREALCKGQRPPDQGPCRPARKRQGQQCQPTDDDHSEHGLAARTGPLHRGPLLQAGPTEDVPAVKRHHLLLLEAVPGTCLAQKVFRGGRRIIIRWNRVPCLFLLTLGLRQCPDGDL